MKGQAALLAIIALAGCRASLAEQRKEACVAHARAAAQPAGFDLTRATDTGETGSGGMAVVYYRTGDGAGGSLGRMATCTFARGSTEIGTFAAINAAD